MRARACRLTTSGPYQRPLFKSGLARVLAPSLATAPADPAPVAHQHGAPEQVAFEHQGGEARHIPPRREPAQSTAIQGPACGRARSGARTEAGLGSAGIPL